MWCAKLADSSRQFALVDCNNFYVSCERVFHPDWANRPVGVLSNNDGCLVSRSEELKRAGIPMGAPFFKHKTVLREMGAVVVSSNYSLYGDMSARVMAILGKFTPEMEVYSIDEAWLDLAGFPAVEAYASRIANTVYQYTGLPVSIGIAPTKVLAKIANRVCKKRNAAQGVFRIGNDDSILASVPVEDIWGVGQRWAQRLRTQGLQTALDLQRADLQLMRDRYGSIMQRLILELRGVSCLGLEKISPRRQIIVSRSFGSRVKDLDPLIQAISAHATRAGEKLRAQSLVCGALQVTIRSSRFDALECFFSRSALIHFVSPTADTRPLIRAACQGVREIYQPGPQYAKARVMLLDLSPAAVQQPDLFSKLDDPRSLRLMQTVDDLNRRYGRHTLFWGSTGMAEAWGRRQHHKTPAFTTKWDELPQVR